MIKIRRQDKDKIISEFETMKDLETSARDLYVRISSAPGVKDRHIKNVFAEIAEDEQQHADLVEKIIDIVNVSL
jgi:rubrerythrin